MGNMLLCLSKWLILLVITIKKIPGIGRVTVQRLQKMGLETCGDIQQFDYISERIG